MGGVFDEVLVEFDRKGSLPTTHDTQGSDMGLFGGLMGWNADDGRLPSSMQVLRDTEVRIRIGTVFKLAAGTSQLEGHWWYDLPDDTF